MKDFFKYLTPGDDDKEWGLFLTVAGRGTTNANEGYPKSEHPSGYYYTWRKGRVLNEYQILYITKGAGVFEMKNRSIAVKQGSIIIIQPNQWHRYRPLKQTGWQEQYIGFNGKMADQFLQHPLFPPQQPVLNIGIREEILDTYLKTFELVEKEKPGFQQVASGMVLKLLGYLVSFEKQREFHGKRIASIVEEVRFRMRDGVEQNMDLEKIAMEYHIGYSYFRKMFKSYTGIAPHKYHLELKIMRAKELLLSTDKSVKEISFELGFQSIYYFSRLFKKKVGVSPSEIRE